MEFLNGMPDVEWTKNFLSEAARSELFQGLLVIGVLWHAMGRKVADHFRALEGIAAKLEHSVTTVAQEISDLRQTVEKGLSVRLDAVENRVSQLEHKEKV